MNTWTYDIPTWYPEDGSTYIGNGFIGGNMTRDGHGTDGRPYLASMAANYMGPREEFVGVPHWLNAPLTFNSQPVRPAYVKFNQVLDLEKGTFRTAYTDSAKNLRVETETFCHRELASVTPYRVKITALQAGEIELTPQLDCTTCREPAIEQAATGETTLGWVLNFNDDQRRIGQCLAMRNAPVAPVPFHNGKTVGAKLRMSLQAGQTFQVDVLVVTTRGPSPRADAERQLKQAVAMGYDALKATHQQAMAALWDNFRVKAEDPYLERQLRSSMFYLTAGYRDDVIWGGCPTSLSSKPSWGNCVFWDTEFYMFPPLLLFHPQLAKNTLMYRYSMLAGAKLNAKNEGAQGARFGWQSHLAGSGHGGAFENEIHISADIAYCAWWYARSTGDTTFMNKYGRELIVEVARYFASRTTWNATANRWEIHNVIPPDEHVWDHYAGTTINNSVMINAYAQWVLRMAPEIGKSLVTAQERDAWPKMAAGMYLPRNEEKGIYWEYDGYYEHPIKQADVAHLFFPLLLNDDPAEIKRNVAYYSEREKATGLCLLHSPFVYAAGLSRAGDAKGVRRFYDLAKHNFLGPFDVPRESNYGGGVCTTASGSFLDLAMFGLLGIETEGRTLKAHPSLVDDVGALEVDGIFFHGERYRVAGTPGKRKAVIEKRS